MTAAFLTVALALGGGASPAQAVPGVPVVLEANLNERRAVRGRGLPDVNEPAELGVLRRFERGRGAGPTAAAEPLPEWATALDNPGLPVPLDREVLAFVEYLKSDVEGRPAAVALLGRLERWGRPVAEALAREGAPSWLLYAALGRSGFDPLATAADGSAGPWMLAPDRARALGLPVGYWLDGRRDPVQASEAVARFLRAQVEAETAPLPPAVDERWPRALLALYRGNAEGQRAPGDAAEQAAEQRFLARVFALALVANNRPALGFDPAPADSGPRAEPVELPAAVTLATVARAAGTSIEVVRALNPALLRDRLPPEDRTVTVLVPQGTAGACRAALPGLTGPADRVGQHVLRVGEDLEELARRHRVSARELRRLNGARDAAELRGGTVVLFPRRPEGQLELAVNSSGEAEEPEPFVLAGLPNQEFSYPERQRVFYRTCEGDTLAELGSVFELEPAEIETWNLLDRGARLQPRMVLQLYVRGEVLERQRQRVALVDAQKLKLAVLGSEEFHTLEAARRGKQRVTVTARAGDTLVKIARRLGLTPGDLARVNRQAWWTELPEGQRIIAYTAAPGARELTVGRSLSPSRPQARPAPAARPAPRPAARKPGKSK